MKKVSKWPSRAFNLLMVLAMVISLSAILVASPAAAAPAEPCSQTPVYDGCHLDVAVATYVKDLDTGAFTPQSSFTPNSDNSCFYVNAVVVNDGNETASAPINATIVLPGDGSVALDTNEVATKVSDVDLQGTPNSSEPHRMADFWWRVCCTAANGNATIGVNVTADSECDQEWPAYGETTVYQGTSPTEKCVTLEIVEAPGMPSKEGHLGNYTENPDTASGVVSPCTNFGIKAEITNNCDDQINMGNLVITWPGDGDASIVGGDYNYWTVGTLQPGQTQAVAWTLHCESPGDVHVTVTPTNNEEYVTYIDDPWTVHQKTPGGLTVTIIQPTAGLACDGSSLVIKQPSPPANSICSNLSAFTVTAVVTNNGDSYVNGVSVTAAASIPSWVTITNPGSLYNLPPDGGNVTVHFPANCIGTGLGNITVSASGTDAGTGQAVYSQSDYSDTRWWRTIDQTQVIAQQTPDVATPSETNICNPNGFDVSFRYTNYTNNSWTAPANGNITACITWTGNVTLDGNVSYRRITGGVETAWVNLGVPSSPTDSTDCEQVRTDITQLIPAICPCCSVDVKWHFVCTGPGPVTFQSNITVQQISPAFTGTDTSEPVCVDQVWKAHLIGDVFFFVQDSNNLMVEQDAVTPGTDFHVVIPVENTGDADAQSVQVYFTVTDQPLGNCSHSYQFENYSGDGTLTVVGTSGNSTTYIANLGDIPGHSAKKAILYMQCLCEGTVSVWIVNDVSSWGDVQGIRAFDANTGEAVPQANILIPPCPLIFEQMPFTIVMENPQTCETFNEGTMFPVKAKITNGSADTDLDNVSATLNWNSDANVELVEGNQTLNGDSHSCTKLVGNITAGTSGEITWEMECTGGGEVYFNVYAEVTSPMLTVYSAPDPQFPPYTVNVHQIGIPTACLKVTILSPDDHQSDNPDQNGKVMVATGQEFAVSAKVYNEGPAAAENVVATLCPNCESSDYVTLADGQSDTINLGTIDDGDFLVATWTLMGGGGNDWGLKDCSIRTDDICVNATTDTNTTCEAWDDVEVSIYPAAFLVTTMDITPSTGIVLGDQFTVDYTVTNYGVADATSAAVTLAADNSNVHIAAGTGGLTQVLGTIPGWSFGEPYNSVSGNFTLQCTAQGLTTLTLTPTGQDECGWQPVLGWTEWQHNFGPRAALIEEDTNVQWVQLGLSPIYSGFLAPDSDTIEQSLTGTCPDVTSMDIDLNAGWNLISLPLIPTGGNVTVSALFGSDLGKVEAIWGYNGSFFAPTTLKDGMGYWVLMSAGATITENGAVNPTGATLPPSYLVAAGWNLIGFKSTCARTAASYLSGVPWVRIWSYNSAATNPWLAVQSGDWLQPGLGYWIAATSAGTYIYP